MQGITHPELIDWDQTEPSDIPLFSNDEAIFNFLYSTNPKTDSPIEHHNKASNQESVKFSSCKMNNTRNRSDGENHSMAVSDLEKVKRKSVSNSENLSEVLKDGRFDTLLEHFQEQSKVLVEPTKSINIGNDETMKTVHLVESLTNQERPNFIKFFTERQINFVWSYVDMLGIDPKLIMHHLSLPTRVKPIKQKLRKMHLYISILVKA